MGAREQPGSIEKMTREQVGAARADSLELRPQAHKKGQRLEKIPLVVAVVRLGPKHDWTGQDVPTLVPTPPCCPTLICTKRD